MPRVTITVPEKKPQPYRFPLDRQTVRLGRGSDNDIVIDCASVSVRHAEMERVPGGYRLRDLGSTNGTKLGGGPKEVIELKNDLEIKLGDVVFDFLLNEDELRALKEEAPATPSPVLRGEDSDEERARSPRAKTHSRDDGDADDEAPRKKAEPKPRPKPQRLPSAEQPSAAASFFATIFLFVLAIAAFLIGLSLHHQNESGRSLFRELFGPKPAAEAPANPTDGENPAPAGHE